MSRPILSRPRTRVYDCNYDKGESYYKPMMDHLDRKYSARPLFPESRGSFADEIAARRSDIGSRNLSGSRNGISNSDLDYESPRPKKQVSHSFYGRTQDDDHDDNEETVYDIWGQRTNRLKLRNDVSNEIASATQRFKDQATNLSQNTDHTSELKHSIQQQFYNIEDKVSKNFKYSRDDNNFIPFQRYSDNMLECKREHIPPTKWSKLVTPDSDTCSNATIRVRQTKARLEDLENEIEELAERQAQRERRAVALKAFVSENTSSSQFLERNEQSHTFKCSEKKEKNVNF
ncbi:GSCOCG00011985001-RA-CDS [Cotesia congregata]|nr:GSCOCG00011985001-RA-CDS [Cotesia congregata]